MVFAGSNPNTFQAAAAVILFIWGSRRAEEIFQSRQFDWAGGYGGGGDCVFLELIDRIVWALADHSLVATIQTSAMGPGGVEMLVVMVLLMFLEGKLYLIHANTVRSR